MIPDLSTKLESMHPSIAQTGEGRWLVIRRGPETWTVRAQWRECILGAGSPDWFTVEREPKAEVAKSGRGRSTWRVPMGSVVIYAKTYEAVGGASGALAIIGMHAAQREWRALRRANELGVNVAACLALGSRTDGRRFVLLTQGIDDARTLWEAWSGAVRGAERRSLIDAVADLFADSHRRGFVHTDAHPRNILVRPKGDGSFAAYFVDVLAGSGLQGWGVRRSALDSLGQLAHAMTRSSTRIERMRFLLGYLRSAARQSNLIAWAPREWALAIDSASRRQAVRLAWQRDKRLSGNGRYFSKIELQNGWSAFCVLRLSRRHVFPEPHVPDRTVEQWRTALRQVPVSANDTVNRPKSSKLDGFRWEVYSSTGGLENLSWTLVGSPARKAFVRSHQLRHRDISAPLVLGYAERRRGGRVTECAVIHPVDSQTAGHEA